MDVESIPALTTYQIEQCSSKLEKFKIVSININGLVSKEETRKKLNFWVEDNEPDVVCIQEWYLHNGEEFPEFPIKYKGYSSFSTNNKTAILYKDTLSVYLHKGTGKQHQGQSTDWVSIYSKKKVVNIASYYQSPSAQFNKHFNQNLNELAKQIKDVERINSLKCKEQYWVIAGDFNARSLQWTDSSNKKGDIVSEWIDKNKFTCINNGAPTHTNKTTLVESAIDLTLVSDNLVSLTTGWTTEPTEISDHYYVCLNLNFIPINDDNVYKTTYKFKNDWETIENYENCLMSYLPAWKSYALIHGNDIKYLDKIVDYFQNVIKLAAAHTFGIKTYCKNSKFWLNNKCKQVIRTRRKLRKKLLRLKKNKRNNGIAIQWRKHINCLTNRLRKFKKEALIQYQQCIEQDIEDAAIGDTHL